MPHFECLAALHFLDVRIVWAQVPSRHNWRGMQPARLSCSAGSVVFAYRRIPGVALSILDLCLVSGHKKN
jgi:hypothetical protein